MKQKFNLILQDEILKNAKLDLPESWSVYQFSGKSRDINWRELLKEIEADLQKDVDNTVLSFLTIPCAGYMKRQHPNSVIANGLLFPSLHDMYDYRNPLFWNVWNSVIPDNMKLNNTYFYSTIQDCIESEGSVLPNEWKQVFVKPVSPWKPFAGFDCSKENLKFELEARISLENVDLSETIIIDSFKAFPSTEWRMYFLEDKLVSFSSYSWENEQLPTNLPEEVKSVGERASMLLSKYGDNYVIDAVLHNGKAKILEINAISTSGWYEHLDTKKLLIACSQMFIAN